MPRADFFAKLGLFIRPNFIGITGCDRLCAEMRTAPHEPALVNSGRTFRVDENSRRVCSVSISEEMVLTVAERLADLLPELSAHFGLELKLVEELQFLRYGVGDFFEAHADSSMDEDAFDYVKERRVSLVIFLNDVSKVGELANCYSGGSLTFYGIIDKPAWQSKGFELLGETGLLVAFRSDLFHEVKPVIEGERFTIVTWLAEK